MSWGTSNRDGGKTSESGHLRAVSKIQNGEVLNGLAVSQRGAGANMSVDIAVGDALIMRADSTYGHPAFNDAIENKTVTTADGSNPRRDVLVIYVDYGQARSTAVSNNTNGVIKSMIVAGTPAGSPTDPSSATIQSAVGSGNPYIKLARIRVPAGQTSITNSLIDDMRKMASAIPNGGWKQLGEGLSYSAYTSGYKQGVIATTVDYTGVLQFGARIKFWQASVGWVYGLVHAVSSSTITVFFGTDYALANETIYLAQYSYDKAPMGFNPNEEKWTLVTRKTTRTTQAVANTSTWYNLGGSLQIGIGSWLLSATDLGLQTHTSGTYMSFVSALGTASNGSLISDSRQKAATISIATTEVDDTYAVDRIPYTTAAAATIYLLRATGTGAGLSLYSEQTADPFTNGWNYIKALSAAL